MAMHCLSDDSILAPHCTLAAGSAAPLCLQTCAQVLLTLDNLADSVQYLNARNTFEALLKYGVIPVVNENVRAQLHGLELDSSTGILA